MPLMRRCHDCQQWVASAYEARAYAGEVSEPGLAGAVRARLDGKRR